MTGKTVLMGGIWDSPGTTGLYHSTTQQALASPVFRHNWSLLARNFDGLIKELGFADSYIYAKDEPGYDATGELMRNEKVLCTWAKEGGFKTASAITLPAAESIRIS